MNKEELINEINRLKKEKNAVVLAHYYQNEEIQDIADYIGDSLALANIAKTLDNKILVVCGVDFMGETAKILASEKKVLLPRNDTSCYMANTITEKMLEEYKKNNPDTIVITYVNTTAKTKALADICVTSSNAFKIIKEYTKLGKKILYAPDKNLATYFMKKENVKLELWNGFCDIHNNISLSDVLITKSLYQNALFIAHPECNNDCLEYADYVGSTKQMLDYVSKSSAKEFIIGTEIGVIYQMKKLNPDKKFIPLSIKMSCRDMKKNTLEDLYNCLLNETYEVNIPDNVISKAKISLERMLILSKEGATIEDVK